MAAAGVRSCGCCCCGCGARAVGFRQQQLQLQLQLCLPGCDDRDPLPQLSLLGKLGSSRSGPSDAAGAGRAGGGSRVLGRQAGCLCPVTCKGQMIWLSMVCVRHLCMCHGPMPIDMAVHASRHMIFSTKVCRQPLDNQTHTFLKHPTQQAHINLLPDQTVVKGAASTSITCGMWAPAPAAHAACCTAAPAPCTPDGPEGLTTDAPSLRVVAAGSAPTAAAPSPAASAIVQQPAAPPEPCSWAGCK